MGGNFSPWIVPAAVMAMTASIALLFLGLKLCAQTPLRSAIPFWTYLLVYFLFWNLGVPAILWVFQACQIPLMPERPFDWMLLGNIGLTALLLGGWTAGRLYPRVPKVGLQISPPAAEIYFWGVTFLFLTLFLFRSRLAAFSLDYWIQGFLPLLITGPAVSVAAIRSGDPLWLWAARLAGFGLLILAHLATGGRQIAGYLTALFFVALWGSGFSLKKLLPWVLSLLVAGVFLLNFVGVLRGELNRVDFQKERTFRSLATYREALRTTSLQGTATVMEVAAEKEAPFLALFERMAQLDSVWIMEASQKTGHLSGWRGFAILPAALVPGGANSAKRLVYDSHARYAVYGLREREAQKFSALPLRTLADTYERFRIPGVVLFHFALGACLGAISLMVRRQFAAQAWFGAAVLGLWGYLAAGAVEMTLLENIIRFTYGMIRDFTMVLIVSLPLWWFLRRNHRISS